MNRREFVTVAGASCVAAGVAVPRVARASSFTVPWEDGDQTEDIRDALEAYDTVTLEEGEYLISESIEIPSGVALVGAGPTATTLSWTAPLQHIGEPLLTVQASATDVYVAQLAIKSLHSPTQTRVGESGIEIGQAEVDIEDCDFWLSGSLPVLLAGIDGLVQIRVS